MTSLMEALEDLGELMADNLVTKGVSDADPSDGLTTLANKILQITPGPGPTPTVDSVSLTGDKSILSYADSESATLSATVLDSNDDPMSGVTVEFFKGSTSLGTADTNSSGVATKSYASAGAGDVSFTAVVGTIVSETCVIEDCTYYHESAFTSSQSSFNVELPSNFEISFITKRTSSSGNSAYLEIGGNNSNTALMGQIGGAGVNAVRIYDSEGSSTFTNYMSSDTPLNQDANQKWVHNGSDNTFSMNSNTVTWTDNKTHSKIRKLSITNNRIEQLKIKPIMV